MNATTADAPPRGGALGVDDIAALRLDLTNHGVRLGADVVAAGLGLALAIEGASLPGESAEGIDLILPGGWWANVSVAPTYAKTSPYTLTLTGPGEPPSFALRHRSRGDIPVTLPVTSRFRHQRTHTGHSCGEIGAVHGNWLVVSPFQSRDGLGLDRPRRFLGLPPQRPLTKGRWSVDEVVACAEAAWEHAGARLVHLEAGHLLRDDGGLADLVPYIEALHRALPTLVSVNVLPPAHPDAVLALYAAGCDAISYHLLAWDEASAATVAETRSRFVPHQRILTALEAAARYFPPGATSTDLLMGLEPLTGLPSALRELIARGVVPNLAVFRPLPGADDDAPNGDLLPTEPLLALMRERHGLISASRLWHSCIRGFPRTLSGFDRYRPRMSDRLYAALRRRWRVDRGSAETP